MREDTEPPCVDDRPHEYGPFVRLSHLGFTADNPGHERRRCRRCGVLHVIWPEVWRFPKQEYWRRDS